MQLQYWTPEMEKQLGERLQILLQDDALLRAYRKFGAEPFRRSSVFHGLSRFLASEEVTGECCFEIGTWYGLTAVVLSQFFEHVVTVDTLNNPEKEQIVKYLGIKNITFLNVRDNSEKAQVAKSLAFDFAYLDGNHTDDTQSDWLMTKHCGRVLFHEVWPFQKPVYDLVTGLETTNPDAITYGGACLALWRSGT